MVNEKLSAECFIHRSLLGRKTELESEPFANLDVRILSLAPVHTNTFTSTHSRYLSAKSLHRRLLWRRAAQQHLQDKVNKTRQCERGLKQHNILVWTGLLMLLITLRMSDWVCSCSQLHALACQFVCLNHSGSQRLLLRRAIRQRTTVTKHSETFTQGLQLQHTGLKCK